MAMPCFLKWERGLHAPDMSQYTAAAGARDCGAFGPGTNAPARLGRTTRSVARPLAQAVASPLSDPGEAPLTAGPSSE